MRNSVNFSVLGSNLPTLAPNTLPYPSQYQIFPAESNALVCGLPGVGARYSVYLPVSGSINPSELTAPSVTEILPSLPVSGVCGKAPGVGTASS